MKIHASIKDYQVHFGQDFEFIRGLEWQTGMYLVIDQQVYELYQELFAGFDRDNIYLLDAVEEQKTIETALDLCAHMTTLPTKRNSHLIAVGGGITQDITGFAANILYRGIHWTLIPTTLLASCDSCIGGKTSLNYKQYKNLLGTFFPPDDIFIYPEFFQTLSEKDFYSGLGEVVKFNIMRGPDYLRKLEEDLPKLLTRDEETVREYVRTSLEFKKGFIEADEFDRGKRILLNFAHTFGHAIEAITKYEIPHGAAVAIGTLMANDIAANRGYISVEQKQRMETLIKEMVSGYVLGEDFCLEQVVYAMKKDKKQRDRQLTVVLFQDENLELAVFHDLEQEELQRSIAYIKDFLNQRSR